MYKGTGNNAKDLGLGYYDWLMYSGNNISRASYFNSVEKRAINEKAVSSNRNISEIASNEISDGGSIHLITRSYPEYSIEDGVREASEIVEGKVMNISATQKDENGNVFRLATLEVDESLKGSAIKTVQIRIYGGKYEGDEYIYANDPGYKIGDELLAMLTPRSERDASSAYGAQYDILAGDMAYELNERNVSESGNALAQIEEIRGLCK